MERDSFSMKVQYLRWRASTLASDMRPQHSAELHGISSKLGPSRGLHCAGLESSPGKGGRAWVLFCQRVVPFDTENVI